MSFTNDKCEVSFNDINGNGKSIQYYDREDGWVKTPQLKKRGRVTAEIKEPAWSGSEAEFSIYLENGGYAKFRVGCPTFSDNYCQFIGSKNSGIYICGFSKSGPMHVTINIK